MNKEEIIKISIILKKELPLTNSTLIRYGFSEERIEELIKEKMLNPISYKKYQLSNIESLYHKGTDFLLKKDYATSDKYFEVCYKIEPQNRDVSMQLLLKYIKKRQYQKVYQLFEHILQIEPSKYQVSNNIYLYLISFLPNCPKEYLELVKNINYHNMTLPINSNDKFINKLNTISEMISGSKYTLAIRLINDIITEEPNYQVKYQLLKELLLQVSDIEKEFKSKLTYLAKSESYNEIINILELRKNERPLNEQEEQTILLCKIIIKTLETKTIPKQTIDKTDNLTEALLGNNFNLATKLNNCIKKDRKKAQEKDPVSILLIKIYEVIDVIKQEYFLEEILRAEASFNEQHTETKVYDNYSFVATSDLFDELKKDGHIPTKKELAEALKIIDITIDHEFQDTENLAYYLKEENIPLDKATKKYGIMIEQVLLIKLIYARDYYAEGKSDLGDKLLHEVEISLYKTPKVNNLLKEIKNNKSKKSNNNYTRKKNKK